MEKDNIWNCWWNTNGVSVILPYSCINKINIFILKFNKAKRLVHE